MTPAAAPELSIVIPCFNEQENVEAIHAAVKAEAAKHAASHEIIFIDNHSTDRTRALLREICARDPHTRAILNNRNYGQMRSPTYGIFQTNGSAVIGMGADFQDPPAMIGVFLQQWRAGAQVVLGQRRRESSSLALRIIRKVGYAFLGRFADYPIIPGATGFGLFDRKVVDALTHWNEPEPFFRGMLVESGFRIAVVPFDRPPRAAGESKNGFGSLFAFALSALSGSAPSLLRLPLVLAGVIGVLAGLLFAAWFVSLFTPGPVAALGWLSAGCVALALVLLSIGLLSEQVRLLSERSRNVPLVTEEERINFPLHRSGPVLRRGLTD